MNTKIFSQRPAWGIFLVLCSFVFSSTSQVKAIQPASTRDESPVPRWQSVSDNNAPPARFWHTAIWTGSEMIVFGGVGEGYGYLNSGARYNPASDTWTPLPIDNAPSPRAFHTAVWTGSEMIVWGGCCEGGATNSGARYNPTTNTWTPLPTDNAPAARYDHTAVWTGKEMIIWGGTVINDQVLGDGARYNPNTDSWTPISTVGAPSARRQHRAVWTGTEMIVVGGTVNIYGRMDGARYNPDSDSWLPLSTNEAPFNTNHHLAAVWTGSEMIVWGGWGGDGSYTNDGGRYNPISDSWTLNSTIGIPSERSDYTEVWTGLEMIVWGGAIGGPVGGIWNDGGRYSPVGDRWMPIPTSDAPSARYFHTAVWTGEEMIVWGGHDEDTILGDGARLRVYHKMYIPIFMKE